ncbi:MAG: hypothetical protein IAE79_17830 [Anaerolinea sp.]|nr:hypothetical protein [Anaerolinea sp.]
MSRWQRAQNEKQFDSWLDLADGGRIYEKIVPGKHGWLAIYYKQVNAIENTVRFWQEIKDQEGNLREIHEKYPIDKGHIKL